MKGLSQLLAAAGCSGMFDSGKDGMCSTYATIFPPCLPLGGPAYTSHVFGIYQQVIAAGAPNCMGVRVPVHSNLHLHKWRELAQTTHDHEVVDFQKYGFPAGFEGEVPSPSYYNLLLPGIIPEMCVAAWLHQH